MDKDTRRWRERKKGTWERSQFASRSSPRAKLLSLSDLFSLKFSLFNQSDVAKDLCVSDLQLCCIAFVVNRFLPANCPVIRMVPMHFLSFIQLLLVSFTCSITRLILVIPTSYPFRRTYPLPLNCPNNIQMRWRIALSTNLGSLYVFLLFSHSLI